MASVKPVIIPLVADTTGLEPGIDALEALGKVDKETADQFRSANKAFQERGKVLDQSVTSSEKFAAASKKLVESIAGGAIAQATANIKKLTDQVDSTNSEFLALTKTIGLAKTELGKLQQGTPAFEKLSKEIQAAELAMGKFEKEATSSRTQLRQYREALGELEEAGLENTQVFQDMAATAGQLDDQIGDTQARIRALASDTFKLDASIQVIQGVAGAFSVAQGAAALFGDENEEIQQALLRVNAAMSILNGLQQLQNILQRQSAANLLVENALRRIGAASTVLQSLAESRFTVVRVLATGAQNALNAAMAANPAGILLLAISAAAGALLLFANNSDTAAEAQEKLAEQQKKVVESLNEEIDAQERLRNTRQGGLNSINQEISELQARGAARSKILALEGKAIDEEIQNAKVRQQSLAGVAKAEEEFNKVSDEIAKLRTQRALKGIEEQEAVQAESLKSAAAFAEARVAQATKGTQEELDAQIKAVKSRRLLELSDTSLTAGQRAKIVADSEKQIRDLRENFRREQFNEQVSMLQSEAAITTDLAKKLELEKAAVILKAQADSIGKSKEQQITIENQKQAQLKQIDNDATVAILSNRLALYQAAAINEKDDAIKAELEKEAIIVQAQIDSVGKSAAEVLRIEKKKQADITSITLEAERRRGERQLILLRRQAIGETDELKLLENKKQELILQAQIDSAGKSKEERLAIELQLKNDIIEITNQTEAARRNRYAQTLDVVSSLLGSISQIARDRADYQLSILQKQQSEEEAALKKRLENGLITQDQFDKLQLASQEKYAAKQKQIQTEQAIREKRLALFQAIINTASAVVKALPNIPLSVFAGVLGAAQIAVIASKPIPQFAKGTKYKQESGPAIIGEAGPELYYANGKWGYANQATLLNLPKGSKVIPTLETEKILQKYNIPMPSISQEVNTSYGGMKIDYNKLGSAIGKQIGKLPLQVNNWDAKGYSQYQTSISNRVNHLNNKYRIPGK